MSERRMKFFDYSFSKEIPIEDRTFQNEHRVKEDGTTHIYKATVINPYFGISDRGVDIRGGLKLSLVDEVEKARLVLAWSVPPVKKGNKKIRKKVWKLSSSPYSLLIKEKGEVHPADSYGAKYNILCAARNKGIFSLGNSLLEEICKPIDEALIGFYEENTREHKN